MKSRSRLVCLLLLFVFLGVTVLQGFSFFEKKRFESCYVKIGLETKIEKIEEIIGSKPKIIICPDTELLKWYGLHDVPTNVNLHACHVAIFPWIGLPYRYVFVFYNPSNFNILSTAHGRM